MTLGAPLGLLLGLLAAPLAALYFLRLRRQRVVVPSLLLWQALQAREQRASPFDRFRRHPLLWLQLLLLAALTLAFARPRLLADSPSGRSVVLLLDRSASMGATDAAPTRFEAARQQAHALLDGLGAADRVLLMSAGPRAEVHHPFTLDHRALREALDALAPTEAEGALRDGLQLALALARGRDGVEVVVLSDGGGADDLGGLSRGAAALTWLPVGGGDRTNAGIVALDLRRSPANELDRQLFVTAQSFADVPLDASLEVTLDGELVGLQQRVLAPGEAHSWVFPLDGSRRGALRAHLDVPGDRLAADDDAWVWLGPAATRRVALIGADALSTRALAADPRVRLERVDPAQATPERLAGVDAALLFAPPAGDLGALHRAYLSRHAGGPAPLGPLQPLPQVRRWQRDHPVLRFVEPRGAVIARAAQITDAGGLVPILEGDSGPLLLAGERDGRRVVQLAFDPLETDLPMRVAWPLLLLNTVGWLTERSDSGDGAVIATGRPFVRDAPGATGRLTLTGPGGDVDGEHVDGRVRVTDTEQVGLYRGAAGATPVRFAANLLAPTESDLTVPSALALPDGPPVEAATATAATHRELWRWALAAALALLLLEWAAYHRWRDA